MQTNRLEWLRNELASLDARYWLPKTWPMVNLIKNKANYDCKLRL